MLRAGWVAWTGAHWRGPAAARGPPDRLNDRDAPTLWDWPSVIQEPAPGEPDANCACVPGHSGALSPATRWRCCNRRRISSPQRQIAWASGCRDRRCRHARGVDIISDATPLGALQVPASGQPILLMADRQTTGGYPKIATVIAADMGIAGQLAPGDSISFVVCAPRGGAGGADRAGARADGARGRPVIQ